MQIRDTDADWQALAAINPYFAVLTDPKFDMSRLTAAALQDFFRSGQEHVDWIFTKLQMLFGADVRPKMSVDFGCGVGRLLIPMARRSDRVIGVDVSDSMLDRARLHCAEQQVSNIELVKSDDQLSALRSPYDFFNSVIVFQHIPPRRGYPLLRRLFEGLLPGGYFHLQLTYAKDRRFLQEATDHLDLFRTDESGIHVLSEASAKPGIVMSMYDYDLNMVMAIAQKANVREIMLHFTEHGGCHGVVAIGHKEHS